MNHKLPYQALPINTFRKDLQERKVSIGCWCALGSPITTEILGLAGFDWLLLDAEHALNDVLSFVPQLMALKDSPSAPMVRPAWNDTVQVKRLLDAGFYNFLMPYITSKAEAEKAVASLRYPPHGIRGVSVAHRSNKFGTVENYQQIINDNLSLVVQIEDPAGLAAVHEIAAVEGVDGLFVGPSDLSAGLGHLGNANHPDVQKSIAHILATAKAHKKSAGILAPAEADARKYIDMGFNLVAVGSDIGVLRAGTVALRNKFSA